MGRVFTETYDLKAHLANRGHPDLQLLEALQLIVLEREQLLNMKLTGGRIFVLTAGMMTEGTPAHELALRMAGQDERQAIFFVGYADPGHAGRTPQGLPARRAVYVQRQRRRNDPPLRAGRF